MKHKKLSQPQYSSSFTSKSSQSYAPFGSVSPKQKRKKKLQQLRQLGPGAYDISLPIIKPIIQTIKKKNNNIIVKLSHIGTSSFQGERQRFHQITGQNSYFQDVGPGKYSPEKSLAILQNSSAQKYSRQFKLPQRKYAGIELSKFIKNREKKAATISEVKRIQIQDYVQMPIVSQQHGHKQKQHLNSLLHPLKKIKGSAWSMMKQQRLKEVKNPYQNIGPGQYYNSNDEEAKNSGKRIRSISEQFPSSCFRSESVRSFFDNICFETNQDKKALLRQAGGYKSSSIGPGTYDISGKIAKQNKFQFFGSTQERKCF